MEAFNLKICPKCHSKLTSQSQLCEYCGYQFENKEYESQKKEIKLIRNQNNKEADNEFINSFAKRWGVEKSNYSYLMQEEGELIKIVGAAGVSELTAFAFKLDRELIKLFLNMSDESLIADAINNWSSLESENFFIDWDCMDVNLSVESATGRKVEIFEKEYDSDKLSLEDKIKIELFNQVEYTEKYNYVMVIDEFRKGEKFEEILRMKTSPIYSNFNNIIEIDEDEYYFYELKTDQWKIKSIEYSFYKISESVQRIGNEDQFMKHIKTIVGE